MRAVLEAPQTRRQTLQSWSGPTNSLGPAGVVLGEPRVADQLSSPDDADSRPGSFLSPSAPPSGGSLLSAPLSALTVSLGSEPPQPVPWAPKPHLGPSPSTVVTYPRCRCPLCDDVPQGSPIPLAGPAHLLFPPISPVPHHDCSPRGATQTDGDRWGSA